MEQYEIVPGQEGRQGGYQIFRCTPHLGEQSGLGGEAARVQTGLVRFEKREESLGSSRPIGFVGSGQCRLLSHTSQDKTIGDRTLFVEIVTIYILIHNNIL